MQKNRQFSNINISIIVDDHIITVPLQIINGWTYSLCHNCIYGMQIYPSAKRQILTTSTLLKLIKELNQKHLKLNLEGHYCIKRRQVVYYPKCEENTYAT